MKPKVAAYCSARCSTRVSRSADVGLAEADAAGLGELGHLGQRFAGEAARQRAERKDAGEVEIAGAELEHLDQARLVEHRLGVGRADQAGDAAGDRRRELRLEHAFVLVARLAAGARTGRPGPGRRPRRAASSVRSGVKSARRPCAGGDDAAVGDGRASPARRGRVAGSTRRPLEIRIRSFMASQALLPAMIDITAIRTAMPKVTCGRITLCAPSATAESISTPRLIGPGCMTIASGLASASFSGREAEGLGVLAGARQHRPAHALVLQAQHDDHVGAADALGQVVADAHAHLLQVAGHQRLRADGADLGHAERRQRMDVGAGDARMDDVADDRHRELGEVLLVVADRVHVEQALRRVRVPAVAGVDHVHVRRAVLRDQVGRAALRSGARRTCRRASPRGWRWCRAGSRPWPCDERAMSRLMTSADSRLAAISKVVRVRVQFSKNRLKTLLPRSSGTFLTSRSLTLRKVPAVSRMCCRIARRQALDRQQVDQFAVAIELRVAADEHGERRRASADLEAEAAGVVARQREPLRRAAARSRAAAQAASIGSSRPPRSTSTARATLAGRPKS